MPLHQFMTAVAQQSNCVAGCRCTSSLVNCIVLLGVIPNILILTIMFPNLCTLPHQPFLDLETCYGVPDQVILYSFLISHSSYSVRCLLCAQLLTGCVHSPMPALYDCRQVCFSALHHFSFTSSPNFPSILISTKLIFLVVIGMLVLLFGIPSLLVSNPLTLTMHLSQNSLKFASVVEAPHFWLTWFVFTLILYHDYK